MEWKRIIKDRHIRILFLLLLAVAAIVFGYQRVRQEQEIEKAAQLAEEYGLEAEPLVSYAQQQAEYVDGYADRIASVLEQSDFLSGISIFQNTDSYSSRNLSRTKADYAKLADMELSYGDYEAVELVLEYGFADYLIFLWGFVLVWMFFEDEKKGLKQVFFATPGGRKGLALQRAFMLAAGDAVFVICCYLFLYAESIGFCGGVGSLAASAQSVMALSDFVFPVKLWQFLLGYVLVRVLLLVAASFLVWMVLSVFRSRIIGMCILVILLGVEGLAGAAISDQSSLVALKYINIFRLVQPGDILYTYRNYNLAQNPCNCFQTLCVLMPAAGAISALLCIAVMAKRRPLYTPGKVETALTRVVKKIKSCCHKLLSGLSLPLTEVYKVLIVHKGILFVVVWLYLLVSQMDLTAVSYMGTSAVLKEAYATCTGEDADVLREYIGEMEEEMASMPDSSVYQDAVNALNSRLEYMERMQEEHGIAVWFLNEKPYRILWTGNGLYTGQGFGDHQRRALFDVVLLVFLLYSVFSYDRSCGMEQTIRSTRLGRRKLFAVKVRMAAALSACVCAVSYGLEIYETNAAYPFTALAAPVQSLSFMEDFPWAVPCGVFLAAVWVLRFLMLCSISMMVCLITSRISGIKGLVCALVLTSGMEVLHMLGFEWCKYLSAVQAVVYVEALQEQGLAYSLGLAAALAVIGGVCYWRLRVKWCGKIYSK